MTMTIPHGKDDAESTQDASKFKPIDYPKADGVLSFDRLTNVSFSATNHGEEQPSHLKLLDNSVPITINLPKFDEPAQRYCPAGVYEFYVMMTGLTHVSKLMRKIASTVKLAISKTQVKILCGPYLKVAVALTIQICNVDANSRLLEEI